MIGKMSEASLQEIVLKLARITGWLCYHTHDSRRSEPGFPDLVMVRGRRILFVELKTARGKLTAEQDKWIQALREAGNEALVWRPCNWTDGTIERNLAKN
jgi:hypothetical protein